MLNLSLPQLLTIVAIVLVSLTIHEYAHSLAAISLGDPTPRQDGRLSLNPLRHIDLVGFILLIVAGFGWAKPVRIDARKLKRPRRDTILIALAGPLSNVLFAFFVAVLLRLALLAEVFHDRATLEAVFRLVTQVAMLNMGLAVFNILPIPPLDGSHLVTPFLARFNEAVAATYFRYGSFALLAIIIIERVLNVDILPIGRVTRAIVIGIYHLLGMFG
jgi:Zn-dependent protease